MSASGLKHVLKTRTYKERSQPSDRRHLGILEKKKDYRLRAKDYHKKEDALKKLREKAAFKNPDEYYFNMAHTRVEGGVHRKREAEQPTADDLRAFKREDQGYLMVKQTAEAKKIERLRATLHMLDVPMQNRHTVFADDEASALAIEAAGRGSTPAELVGAAPLLRRHVPGPSTSTATAAADAADVEDAGSDASESAPKRGKPAVSRKQHAKLAKARDAQYRELEQRVERHTKMGRALQRIGIEKALLGKGPRKKLAPTADAPQKQFKFRQRRKK